MGVFLHATTKMIVLGIFYSLGMIGMFLTQQDYSLVLFLTFLFGIIFLILFREKRQDDYWDLRRKECKNHNERIHLHSMFLFAPYYCYECCERQSFDDSELIEINNGRDVYYILSKKALQNKDSGMLK